MITFQEELNNIYGLKKLDGFQIEKVIYESDKTTILLLKLDDKLLIAKKYDSNDFLKVVKEYLFEFNMKNYFTIEPISIFEYDNGYCIVMDYYLPMSDFFTFFPKKMNDEILQDININKLIFFSILLVSVYSLHVQKVPIIHHDLKPKNILLIPYRIIDGKLQRIEISPKVKYKHEPGTFYIPQLIDFDLTKETDEKTNMMGTPGYRTADFYTEFSDIFSLAIIFEEIILGFTKFNEFNKSSHTNLRIEKDSFYPSLLSDFSFIDKSKVTGLEKIVDMMLTSVKKKDYILLDIIRILTTPNELKKLLPHDFIDEKRFDLYFEILKMFNINFDVCDEFSKISPKIYGKNFNYFLFTMFHQKRNEFKINVFQEYQKKIVDICKQNKIKDDLINDEFCELHEKMNLFCLNQQIKEFTEKYKIESKDKSKLFKILTSLNFKNTRSLHQFVNSLDYTITSTSHEIKYRLELCYGIDYKAKLGFIILNSENLDTAVFNQILVNVLKVTEFQDDWNINSFGLKEINISLDDFYLSEFIEFLNKIEFIPNCTNEEYYRKCEEKYLSMIYDNSRQNKLHKFVSDNYGNDSAFVLLIHYLAFYEIKTERMQRNNDVFDFDISITQSSYDTQSSEQIDDIFAYPKNQNEKTIFDLIFLFKINEIKEDILSQEMIDQMKKYFPVINFMKSLNVCLFDFDKFLNKLYKEEQLETFMKIINDFDEKSIINNLQLLESISFLSVEFFKSIFENIKNETISNKEILKYISNDNFDEDVHNSINNDDFAVLNNLNSQFIFISYGKINYKENLSLYNIINEIDATNRSKIAVCLTQSLVYLTKLPFKIHTQFFKSIFIDDITRLPMIKTTITNEYDNEKLLIDYSYVIEKLIQSNDNRYLNIIKQIYENDDDKNSYLPIQYIFNFFIGKTFNFTFDNTNQEEYQKFICNIIKNPFYDEIFSHLAQELFGQSYASILDYLFKTKKQNPKLTKGEFVNKMRKITKKCLLCKLIDDHDSLNSILNLFNEYFDEDPYNLIHILNQLLIPSDKYKTKNDVKYNKRTKIYQYKMQNEDSEKIISHIYHMMNKFVSPMIYSNKNYLYFKVSDTKYKKEYFNDYKHLSKYHFYYSLKSALYYLCKYNDKNDLLQEMLTIDHIYINEIGEAVVLPFQVDDTSMRNILETVKSDCKIKEKFDISKLRYSITKYIPLKDAHVIKLMKIYGFDYSTELNDIINNSRFYDDNNDEMKIIEGFHDQLETLTVTDDYIIETANKYNKLSPLFMHLLEKATYSTDDEIKDKAKHLLEIFRSIIEIDPNDIKVIRKIGNKETGEGNIYLSEYKGEQIIYKQIFTNHDTYSYLQKIINMLYTLKSLDEKQVNRHIIKEIGFTNFGTLMKYYPSGDLSDYFKSKKKEHFEDGLFWLKFIYRLIESILLLHNNNIIHNDIKPSNILLDDENMPLLCDMINIHFESSFIKSYIKTIKYSSINIQTLYQKDIVAFEDIFIEIIKNMFKKKVECPLYDNVLKSKKAIDTKKNMENIIKSIDVYYKLMEKGEMYLLPKDSSELEKIEMSDKFQIYRSDNSLVVENQKSVLKDILSKEITKQNFSEIVELLEATNCIDKNFNIAFYTSFSEIISKIDLDKNEKHFQNIIDKIDSIIKSDFDKKWSNTYIKMQHESDRTVYEQIGKLIYQRFCLNKLDGIDDDLLLKQMVFCVFNMFKYKEIDEIILKKIIFIIDILDDQRNILSIFMYSIILPQNKPKSILLEKNIVLRLNIIRLNYIKQKINNYIDIKVMDEPINEIFDILIKYDDEKSVFLNYFQNINDPVLEAANENVLSIIYFVYKQYQYRYTELLSFMDILKKYAKNSFIHKYRNLPSNNKYMISFIKDIDYENDKGDILKAINKQIVDSIEDNRLMKQKIQLKTENNY